MIEVNQDDYFRRTGNYCQRQMIVRVVEVCVAVAYCVNARMISTRKPIAVAVLQSEAWEKVRRGKKGFLPVLRCKHRKPKSNY